MSDRTPSTVEVLGSGDAFHSESRSHTSFLIRAPGEPAILFDVGATTPLRLRQGGHDPDEIDSVVLTHFHGDHLLGLPVLLLHLRFVCRREAPVTILGPPGLGEACGRMLDAAYPGIELGFEVRYEELDDTSRRIGALELDSMPVTHRPESLGYRVRFPSGKLAAFSGDAAFDEKLVALVEGAAVAFVEASLIDQPATPVAHVSFRELERRRDDLDVRRLVFTHLGEGVASALRRAEIGVPAWDGMLVEI